MRRKLGQTSTPNETTPDGAESPSAAFPVFPLLGGGRRRWTISLVTALFVLGLVAIVILMLRSAEEQDSEARHLAERQLSAAITSVQRSVASTTLDYAWWDDAYHGLAVTYSKEWAEANLTGATVIGPDKLLQGALVFDQAGQLVFGTWRGQSVSVGFAGGITGGLPQLLDRARRQDAGKPEAVSGFLSIGGQPNVVAAASILPFSAEEPAPLPDRRFVLVFLKVLDPANLNTIGGMMGSSGLKLLPPLPEAPPSSDAVLSLTALDGTVLGEVHWLPPQPGHAIIGRLVPQIATIVGIMAVLAGLAIWLMLNSQNRNQLYLTTIDAKNQRIENALRLWQITTEAIDYGITVFDQQGRLLLWNLAYQRIWNMPDNLLHDRSKMVEMLEWVLSIGGYRLLQTKASDADSHPRDGGVNNLWVFQREERIVEVQRYAVPEIGGFISISRDMTLSRQRETELVQAWEEAVMASRAKSEFLANISHELRTPLNAIIGFSEVLEREIFGPVGNDRYRSYISDIKASGSHLLSLINDILDLSKIEAGKFELRLEKVDCSEVMETVARLIRPRAETGQLEFTIRRPAEPIKLLADERALKQVLINLLSNAVKFTPRGGQVDITCREVPTGVAFSVRDTGIGISAKDIDTALAPFGQIDSNLARRFDGTGLGLPIVRGICELHGGTLTIDSEIGRGTIVTALFPDRMTDQTGADGNVLSASPASDVSPTDAKIGSASLLIT